MKAVIYARYSSDGQREESIEGQLRECKEYAEKNGMTIIGTYVDRALSAKTDNRPEFQKMIKDSNKYLFDVVIVWKLDRFARNRYDSAHYKSLLRKNKVKVLSATEAIAEDSTGILLESLLEGYAEFFSAELSEKVIRGMTENALKCKWNGGSLPIGYRVGDDRHYEVDALVAPFVVEAFQLYADGKNQAQVAQWLNEKEIKTFRNGKININAVSRMLRNRAYIGEYRYAEHVIPNGVPAIVPIDLFEKVQSMLTKNKKAPARHKAEDDYLLTTKLYCGLCGAFMYGESGHGRAGNIHRYYKCSTAKKHRACNKKTVKKLWIEDLAVNEAVRIISDDAILDRIADEILEAQKRENITLPMLQRQLAEAERGIENMLNAIQQGIINQSTKARLDDLEMKKSEIEVKILQEEIEQPLLSREQILFWLHKFRGIDTSKREQRQLLIDTFIKAVYLYDDRVVLMFNNREDSKDIALADIEGSFGSDIISSGVPEANKTLLVRGGVLLSCEVPNSNNPNHIYDSQSTSSISLLISQTLLQKLLMRIVKIPLL